MKKIICLFLLISACSFADEIPELYANRWLSTMHTQPDENGEFEQVAVDLMFSEKTIVIKVAVYTYRHDRMVQTNVQETYTEYTIDGLTIFIDDVFNFTWEDGKIKWILDEETYYFYPCEIEPVKGGV